MDQANPPTETPVNAVTSPQPSPIGKYIAWGIGVGVIALLVVGLLWALGGKTRKGLPPEAIYLPNDTRSVGYFDAEQLRKSSFLNSMASQIAKPDPANPNAAKPGVMDVLNSSIGGEVQKMAGLLLNDIHSVPIFGATDRKLAVYVIKTNAPIDTADVALKRQDKSLKLAGDPSIWVSSAPDALSYTLPDPRTMVVGSPEAIRGALRRKTVPAFSPEMQRALKELNFAHGAGIAIDWNANRQDPSFQNMAAMAVLAHPKLPSILESVDALVVHADIEANIGASVIFLCRNKETARELEKVGQDMVEHFKGDAKAQFLSAALSKIVVDDSKVTLLIGTHASPIINTLSRIGSLFSGR